MSERQNVTNLIRMVGFFVAFPSLTISMAFMLDLDEHLLHIAGLFPLGVAGVAAIVLAPRLAARWVPADA